MIELAKTKLVEAKIVLSTAFKIMSSEEKKNTLLSNISRCESYGNPPVISSHLFNVEYVRRFTVHFKNK